MSQTHMNKESFEALSAGVDGELSAHELRFLLRRLDHETDLQQAWSRYHLVRDGLRRRLPSLASADFAARTSAAIAREAPPATAVRNRRWLRWSAGGAIAASVAAATLMIGQPAGDTERMVAAQDAPSSVSALASASSVHAATAPSTVPPWLSGSAAGALSQRASATLGSPFATGPVLPTSSSATYTPLYRYRALDNHDGSYLLLLDPAQSSPANVVSRRAAATAQ
ncbi:MAG TPA: sigma-E factor negative regulatory protein [Rhodanobacter sp.]|nr:sigma-E factor negative regulatory protein [Rhodanobacter sp.]